MLNLSCSLEKVSHRSVSRDLLWLDLNLVALVAELAHPELLVALGRQSRCRVEHALALLAEAGVASGQLSSLLQDVKLDLEHVCIELYLVLLAIFFLLLRGCSPGLADLASSDRARVLVTEVEIAVEVVRVHFVAREVSIHRVLALLFLGWSLCFSLLFFLWLLLSSSWLVCLGGLLIGLLLDGR